MRRDGGLEEREDGGSIEEGMVGGMGDQKGGGERRDGGLEEREDGGIYRRRYGRRDGGSKGGWGEKGWRIRGERLGRSIEEGMIGGMGD